MIKCKLNRLQKTLWYRGRGVLLMENFWSGGNIWVALSSLVALLSLIRNISQKKEINHLKKEIYMKDSGSIGKNAKAGGDIVGRDKK